MSARSSSIAAKAPRIATSSYRRASACCSRVTCTPRSVIDIYSRLCGTGRSQRSESSKPCRAIAGRLVCQSRITRICSAIRCAPKRSLPHAGAMLAASRVRFLNPQKTLDRATLHCKARSTLQRKACSPSSRPGGGITAAGVAHERPVDSPRHAGGTPPRPRPPHRSSPPEVRPADQPVLSQGPARQLRQARPDPLARPDQHRRRHARRLGGRLLGREPAPGAAPVGPVPPGRRDLGPPDLRRAGVCPGEVVSRAGCRGRPGRAARPVLPRGGRPARRRRRRSARGSSAGGRSSAMSRRGR